MHAAVAATSRRECITAAVLVASAAFVSVWARRRARLAQLQSQLINACRSGHADVVREMLQSGATCNVESLHGHLPLNTAAYRGRIEVMRVLLSAGAVVDAQEGGGGNGTALFGACMQGQLEAVKLLCAHGASRSAHIAGHWSSLDLVATVEEELADLRRSVEENGQQAYGPPPERVEAVLSWLRDADRCGRDP